MSRYRPNTNNKYNNRYTTNTTKATNTTTSATTTYTLEEIKSWKNVHIKAKYATTTDKRNEFEQYIRYLAIRFPCGKCRTHIGVYIRENPIPKILTDKTIYKWAWSFHNSVNQRLGKPIVSWEKSLEFYKDL